MSNLTTTTPHTTFTSATPSPTFTFTNSSIPHSSTRTQIRTSTSPNGEVETVTDITIVQPTGAAGSSSSETTPAGPTSTGAGEKMRVGFAGWVVALLAVGVGMGFM